MIYRLFSFQHTFFYFYLILCVVWHTRHTKNSSNFSSPNTTQSLDITTFLKFLTQKIHKNRLFFYVFLFLKQFQKYSLRSYFQDLWLRPSFLLFSLIAFALCCFYSKVHLTIGTHGYKLKKT